MIEKNKDDVIEAVYNELLGEQGNLCQYQKDSVEKICEYLQTGGSRVLLADEVGMGKTYIAKGIIAKMIKDRKNTNSGPCRVGYICPNQEIAEQNYKKLRLYPEYSNPFASLTDQDYKDMGDLLKEADNAGLKNCVYTRILEWLLVLKEAQDDVKDFFDNMDEGLKLIYVDKQEVKGNHTQPESTYNRNRLNKCKEKQVDKMRDFINKQEKLSKYIDKIEYEDCKKAASSFFKANKNFIAALNNGAEDDSRISMSHLFSWERENQNFDSVMIIDALTSQTSFNIKNGEGTTDERALLQATIEVFIKKIEDEKSFLVELRDIIDAKAKKGAKKDEDYKEYKEKVEIFKKRLSCFPNQIMEMNKEIKEKLADAKNISDIRRVFIDYNVENTIHYDLMILDEFQNFRELIDPNYSPKNSSDKSNVAYNLVDKLLRKEETKTVLLSATPFSIDRFDGNSLISYSDKENMPLSIDEIYAQFKVVIEFLIKDKERAKKWFNVWENNRLTIKDILNENQDKKRLCEKLLWEAGVFRNERAYASKAKMIDEHVIRTENDISYLIRANKYLGKKADCFRSEYGLTPWALSFIDGIQISSKRKKASCIEEYIEHQVSTKMERELFLQESYLNGELRNKNSTPEYRKLVEETLRLAETALLLWIPPCTCSSGKKLSGVFAGKEGISKTLIFCKNQITPKSLTFLLTNDCYSFINDMDSVQLEKGSNEWKEIEMYIKELVFSKVDEDKKMQLVANEIVEYVIGNLFGENERNCIWQRVILKAASLYPEQKDKPLFEKIKWYFESGCFTDVLDEYFSLLKNEYDNNKYRMKNVVRRLNLNEEKKVKIYVNSNDKEEIESKEIAPACGYAIGMYNIYSKEGNIIIAKSVNKMSHVKKIFNSPFWPFVMITTSIGTEGIDLHWYARNIVHWSLPSVAGDIEQREGRLLRYNCHAIRLNKERKVREEDAVRAGWADSGMYPEVINFAEDNCYYINRYIFIQSNTPFEDEWENKKNIINTYRIMLGQQEVVYDPMMNSSEKISENYICLSPYWAKQDKN